MNCPLCHSEQVREKDAIEGLTHHLLCTDCTSVFKHPRYYLTPEAEKKRYELHQNDVNNLGYQRFVAPIVSSICKNFSTSGKGLDFGAGPGPVITKLLMDRGYTLALWDPFFHPDRSVLTANYDFIVCCEVMEHFRNPRQEFQLLYDLLRPGGKLFCMTELLPETPFKDWYYQRDPTHLIFYTQESLEWIKQYYGFTKLQLEEKVIVFTK